MNRSISIFIAIFVLTFSLAACVPQGGYYAPQNPQPNPNPNPGGNAQNPPFQEINPNLIPGVNPQIQQVNPNLLGVIATIDYMYNTDLPGQDFAHFAVSTAAECRQACVSNNNCRAFTFVNAGVQGPQAMCWLKHSVPQSVASNVCTSGIVR